MSRGNTCSCHIGTLARVTWEHLLVSQGSKHKYTSHFYHGTEYDTAKYCASEGCRNVHISNLDVSINKSIRIVIECLSACTHCSTDTSKHTPLLLLGKRAQDTDHLLYNVCLKRSCVPGLKSRLRFSNNSIELMTCIDFNETTFQCSMSPIHEHDNRGHPLYLC